MKYKYWLLLIFVLVLAGCSPAAPADLYYIVQQHEVIVTQHTSRVPVDILTEAEIDTQGRTQVLANGIPVDIDQPLASGVQVIQVLDGSDASLESNGRTLRLQTYAFTIGEALAELDIYPASSDLVEPSLGSTMLDGLQISHLPARAITIEVNGKVYSAASNALTVGQALAEVGLPLMGMDYSTPPSDDPLPENGKINIVRVHEAVEFIQKPIPFEVIYQSNEELDVDSQEIIQVGEVGLSMSRVRVRFENGEEVSQITEEEHVIRPPQAQIISRGTQITLHTLNTPSGPVQYWKAISMYATSYSPCNLGVNRCNNITYSGRELRQGMVAVLRSWYRTLGGTQVYIPGYGVAVIADIGGGFPDGRAWIDLGYTDDAYIPWSRWVTVYFLAPAPPELPWMFR